MYYYMDAKHGLQKGEIETEPRLEVWVWIKLEGIKYIDRLSNKEVHERVN